MLRRFLPILEIRLKSYHRENRTPLLRLTRGRSLRKGVRFSLSQGP